MISIAIGCDHGAYDLKEFLKKSLSEEGYAVLDCGTDSKESVNYPDYAFAVAEKVQKKEADFGIVCCTSGEGVCICANKVKGIRCGIGYNDEVSVLIREHNHANVIAFGAKYTLPEDALRRVHLFLDAVPLDGRHQRRVDLITEYEEKHFR